MGVQRMVFVSASFPPFPATIPLRGYIEVLSVALSASLSLSLSLRCASFGVCARQSRARVGVPGCIPHTCETRARKQPKQWCGRSFPTHTPS
jgi:hypothetical protein